MRPQRDSALSKALTGRRSELRPPRLVMAPARLGAARFTRYNDCLNGSILKVETFRFCSFS